MSIENFASKEESYEFELEQVMQHIVDCYNLVLLSGAILPNDENEIRSHLVEGYLSNSTIRRKHGIEDYLFDAEVGVFRETDFKQVGRSDIKIALKSHTFDEPKKHFIIECKRLDGETNFNREYVKEGIKRFISQAYPTFLNLNGMIGFCVQSFDIQDNINQKINQQLNKWCSVGTVKPIIQEIFIEDFEHTFISSHRTTSSQKGFKLYHLMLDLTSLIA